MPPSLPAVLETPLDMVLQMLRSVGAPLDPLTVEVLESNVRDEDIRWIECGGGGVWWWWCYRGVALCVVLGSGGKPGGPLTVTLQSQEGACCAVHQPATPASPCGPPHLLLPISSSALLLPRLPSSQQPLCVAAAHAESCPHSAC